MNAETVDDLLSRYVASAGSAEARDLLGSIITRHATPILQTIIRRKLGDERDTDDVYSHAVTRLVRALNDRRASGRQSADQQGFDDFRAYVAVIAYNACHDFLRDKYPERHRLKDRLRHVLSRNAEFVVWRHSSGQWVCGRSAWKNVAALSFEDTHAILSRLDESSKSETSLMHQILDGAKSPVRFDDVVDVIAKIHNIDDVPPARIDATMADSRVPADEALTIQEFAASLWKEMVELPPRQRKTILLTLHDASGTSAATLLITTGVASFRSIAEALEMSPEALAEIWNELPYDDARIAGMFEITRQQVVNLRKSARERLSRRMRPYR